MQVSWEHHLYLTNNISTYIHKAVDLLYIKTFSYVCIYMRLDKQIVCLALLIYLQNVCIITLLTECI